MLKYLTVVLLAFSLALSAFGATPAADHSATAHPHATHHSRNTHAQTAAQQKARLKRPEHQRAVKRTQAAHRAVKHHAVKRGVAKHRTATHKTLAQRRAAHRAYERHLAHMRWLRRHRAYEARLKRERKAKAASDPQRGMGLAKADVPQDGPRPLAETVHGAALDYVSHEHVRLYWRSPLRGTHASLVRQDRRDREEGLTRIEDEDELLELVQRHDLIPLPLTVDLQVDPRLAQDRRYTRPWTVSFLRDVGRAYMRRFGEALVITSAVRPATYQRRLLWRNGNAAPANGEIASPHEYGATIDIGKKGMTAREMAWMRGYLFPIQQAGQIDVEEEFHQACFHVTVYTNYVAAPMERPEPEVAAGQMDADTR